MIATWLGTRPKRPPDENRRDVANLKSSAAGYLMLAALLFLIVPALVVPVLILPVFILLAEGWVRARMPC